MWACNSLYCAKVPLGFAASLVEELFSETNKEFNNNLVVW